MEQQFPVTRLGSPAERLANAARTLAHEFKDDEALEAAAYIDPSPIVLVKEMPADDERLKDFLVRCAVLHVGSSARDSRRQIAVYVAEDVSPNDFWFQCYALVAGRAVRNMITAPEWAPVVGLMPEESAPFHATVTGIAQFEALTFLFRQLADQGFVQYADMRAYLNDSRRSHAKPPGEGFRALEFLSWCTRSTRLPEPDDQVRVQAGELFRFFMAMGNCPMGRLDQIYQAVTG